MGHLPQRNSDAEGDSLKLTRLNFLYLLDLSPLPWGPAFPDSHREQAWGALEPIRAVPGNRAPYFWVCEVFTPVTKPSITRDSGTK